MNSIVSNLRSLFQRRQREEDLRDELQFYLDEEAERGRLLV